MKNKPIPFIAVAVSLLLVVSFLVLKSLPVTEPPVIGIPQTSSKKYAAAIEKAGGIPVELSYDPAGIPNHLENLDAVLFPGGADIPPSLYGEENIHPTVKLVSDERLTFEYQLAKAWLKETEKPFLGVCLGCQMLNVVQGGTLVQDIPSEFGGNHREDHEISIEPGSKLDAIFEEETIPVNSNHHQCVRDLGEGLQVVAKSPDGIIEGIELNSERFVLGVQWHPEKMTDSEEQQKLFETFVKAARTNKSSKNR